MAEVSDGPITVDWESATKLAIRISSLEAEAEEGSTFDDVPAAALKESNYKKWSNDFDDHLYHSARYDLFQIPGLDLISEPGETERDFRIRCRDAAHEARDEQIEALREKYARKLDTAEERIRKAEQKVGREQEQAEASKMQTMVNIGSTVLSAFLGRKAVSRSSVGKASTTMRGLSRGAKEKQDVERALEDLSARREAFDEINNQLEEEIDELKDRLDADFVELSAVELKPRRTDINIHLVGLAWVPYSDVNGRLVPVWE
jgi:prefoldin subunit 5